MNSLIQKFQEIELLSQYTSSSKEQKKALELLTKIIKEEELISQSHPSIPFRARVLMGKLLIRSKRIQQAQRLLAGVIFHSEASLECYWTNRYYWANYYWVLCALVRGNETFPHINKVYLNGLHNLIEASDGNAMETFPLLNNTDYSMEDLEKLGGYHSCFSGWKIRKQSADPDLASTYEKMNKIPKKIKDLSALRRISQQQIDSMLDLKFWLTRKIINISERVEDSEAETNLTFLLLQVLGEHLYLIEKELKKRQNCQTIEELWQSFLFLLTKQLETPTYNTGCNSYELNILLQERGWEIKEYAEELDTNVIQYNKNYDTFSRGLSLTNHPVPPNTIRLIYKHSYGQTLPTTQDNFAISKWHEYAIVEQIDVLN